MLKQRLRICFRMHPTAYAHSPWLIWYSPTADNHFSCPSLPHLATKKSGSPFHVRDGYFIVDSATHAACVNVFRSIDRDAIFPCAKLSRPKPRFPTESYFARKPGVADGAERSAGQVESKPLSPHLRLPLAARQGWAQTRLPACCHNFARNELAIRDNSPRPMLTELV